MVHIKHLALHTDYQMINRNMYIIILLLFTLISSCGEIRKDEYTTVNNFDKKVNDLTSCSNKEWKVVSHEKNGVDLLSNLDNCISDNLDIYFCDHRFESVEGNSKCKNENPYLIETGCWYFNEDTTELEVTIGKDFYILKIIELTDNKFHYISTNHDDTVETILKPARM